MESESQALCVPTLISVIRSVISVFVSSKAAKDIGYKMKITAFGQATLRVSHGIVPMEHATHTACRRAGTTTSQPVLKRLLNKQLRGFVRPTNDRRNWLSVANTLRAAILVAWRSGLPNRKLNGARD